MRTLFLTTVVLCVLLGRAAAELPPDVYKADQAQSPEALKITVTRVDIRKAKEARGTRSNITAEAKVLEVKRSASKVRAGDKVRIRYSHFRHNQPIAGPSEPDILQEGRTYPAFLKRDAAGHYTPAGRGYSFRLAQ